MLDFNLIPLLPEIFIAITAMGLLIVGVDNGNESTPVIAWSGIYCFAVSILLLLGMSWDSVTVMNGMFVFDQFAAFMKLLILVGLIVSMAISVRYLEQQGIDRFEYPVLIMLAGIGMMLMVSSNNMLALYMSLELQSLSLYVLASFHRNSLKSSEAGVKYFVLGALSSGMLLFGISMIYGFVGSVDFNVIAETLDKQAVMPFGVTFGLVFILAGLAFKISAVPFHMWTPDVYQGAPTSVTAFFAIVPKLAAMGLLIRLLFEPFAPLADQWGQVIYFLSLASMIVGAFAALVQDNIKRLMAYSSIGNMGYALIGVVAGTPAGVSAVVVYMLIYLIMTSGVFTIILSMNRKGKSYEKVSDLSGLSVNNPVLAYTMAILMFSMSGIPPLAGFFGKLMIFQAAIAEELYVLAVLGVISSVIAAFYYLRIIKVMFFEEAGDALDNDMPFARRAILCVSVAFVICFVAKPSILVSSAQGAVSVLFSGF